MTEFRAGVETTIEERCWRFGLASRQSLKWQSHGMTVVELRRRMFLCISRAHLAPLPYVDADVDEEDCEMMVVMLFLSTWSVTSTVTCSHKNSGEFFEVALV